MDKIAELRKYGIGYKKIASILDMNLNTVKSHCRKHELTSKSKEVKTYCKNCKKEIVQNEKTKKKIFCCPECKRKWWSKNRKKTEDIICLNCNKMFKGIKGRKYCSHACYIEARFKEEK